MPSDSLQHLDHDGSESELGTPFVYQDPVLYDMVAQKMATITEADEAEYSASHALLEAHAAAQAESLLVDAEAAAVPMRKDVVAQKLSEKLGRAPDAAEIQGYIASQCSSAPVLITTTQRPTARARPLLADGWQTAGDGWQPFCFYFLYADVCSTLMTSLGSKGLSDIPGPKHMRVGTSACTVTGMWQRGKSPTKPAE